ncbi:MAG TPA: choice-of-anchor D domain-containing protein, partial [Myxococcales bacterium]|nr:choice-of-anchor D domain-containing protein [Myxococcales bacterium]
MKRALLCAALCACGQTRLTQATPKAIIDTRPIDFGTTPVLFPVERDVLVTNPGIVPLHLSQIAASDPAFSTAATALELDPGATSQLHAIFTPPQPGTFSGKLTLQTDDPATPAAEIDLTGVGALTGAIVVTPLSLDFGRVGEGQTVAKQLSIASTGQADLYLGSVAAAPGAYALVGSIATPATLATGSQLGVDVRFSPLPASEAASGSVTIDSSDPAQPRVVVPLTGSVNHAPVPVAQASALEVPVGSTVTL